MENKSSKEEVKVEQNKMIGIGYCDGCRCLIHPSLKYCDYCYTVKVTEQGKEAEEALKDLERASILSWNNYEYREGELYSSVYKDGFISGVKSQSSPTEAICGCGDYIGNGGICINCKTVLENQIERLKSSPTIDKAIEFCDKQIKHYKSKLDNGDATDMDNYFEGCEGTAKHIKEFLQSLKQLNP